MNITPEIIATICAIVAVAALLGWPREDEPDLEIRPSDTAWAHYFIRLYRATFEGFDRDGFRANRRWIPTTPERLEREAHSVAMTAVNKAWQNAGVHYASEWERINRGYFTMIARLRDTGIRDAAYTTRG